MFQKTLIISAISMAILTGCSDNGATVLPDDAELDNGEINGENNGQNNGENNGAGTEFEVRSLEQIENSEIFFEALREGLARQNSVNSDQDDISVPDFQVAVAVDSVDGAAESTANSAGSVASADSDTSSTDASQLTDVTTTNVQEIGVDEQDRMKSDGEYLYIVDNDRSNEVFPFDNGLVPVGDIEPDVASSSQFFPGFPTTVNPKVRILQLQNDAPDALPINDVEVDLKGGSIDGMYLYKNEGSSSLILTSSSFPNYQTNWYDPYAFNNAQSVISTLDVTNPAQANLSNTVTIDGQIVSSRRIGSNLFLATRYYPTLAGIDRVNMSPDEYQLALESADLTEALPKITIGSNGVATDLINSSECFVSARALQDTSSYYSPDIVTLAVIDLDTMELKDSECFLGSTETLYATPNSIYLATTQWDYQPEPIFELNDTVSTARFVDPRINTDIHQFSIDGAELNYSGSGVVAGHLGWNPDRMPFRMSEKGDHLRVATYSENQTGTASPINVSVLNVAGDGALNTVAQLPNANRPEFIGKPGEQLYASRFLGDKGYLVTFRQTDPLYVVDFSNPNDPLLAGELEIEGYSDYLQPIGEDYLLGIGKDAVASPDGRFDAIDGFGGALVQGIKLSLFDVSDASNPTEVQSLVIGERGTNAEALTNHRAITIQPATDSHPTRVAFGIDVFGQAVPGPITNPFNYGEWNFTGLHGFDIKVGDDAGIEQRGVMTVRRGNSNIDYWQFYNTNDRSVIVGDSTYYISGSSVYAADWNDLGNFVGPK